MTHTHRAHMLGSFALAIACATACGEPLGLDVGDASTADALVFPGVSFRTQIAGRFLGAQNNGGGAVIATATVSQAWEKFGLDDINGGALMSGDTVFIRAGNGQYFQAMNGGGSSLNAASPNRLGWETFRIVKQTGAGAIVNGDVVGLQAVTTGHWVSAENGGGSSVSTMGPAFDTWERLVISGLANTPPPPPPSGETTVANVTLRTTVVPRYFGALNNGGSTVIATATTPQAWETFSVIDVNGGNLTSGDSIHIRAGGGQYFHATNGGGTTLSASATARSAQTTFRITKRMGTGTITSGEQVALQTSSGAWVSAQDGGGSTVGANGPALDTWETLVFGIGATPPPPPPPPTGWRLVWSDEFNGTTLDESKWTYEVQRPGWVNRELQGYTYRRPENVRVENGNLVIEARRDYFDGQEYSSGRIKTQNKASFTYGRVEARIQLPAGRGTWPAFWMMPDNQSRGWPACGEIDIMEHVGYDENAIHGTTHSLSYNWQRPQQRTATTRITGATTGYHTYALEWFADRIEVSVDGLRYFTSPNDNTGDDAWPFNKNFHVIFNLAVGGDWGGAQGVDANIWPRRMLVDYVRVYQR